MSDAINVQETIKNNKIIINVYQTLAYKSQIKTTHCRVCMYQSSSLSTLLATRVQSGSFRTGEKRFGKFWNGNVHSILKKFQTFPNFYFFKLFRLISIFVKSLKSTFSNVNQLMTP